MHAPYWPARLGRLAVVLLVAMAIPLGAGRPPMVQADSSLSFTTSSVAISGSILSAAVGDFNGDGKPDLATPNAGGSNVSVLLGNGDGTFQPARSYAVGTAPTSVAVGDFNGDGKPDLATANSNGSSVSVLLGNGDGTFQSAVSYSLGSGLPHSVVVGDFNGDGKPDLATPNGNSVSVLLGKGDGTFQPAVSYPVGTSPWSLAVGDFNGDGKPDLATANSNSSSVSVLLGNGDGTFQPARSYAVGSGPLSVAVGDFNGDGKLDLASASSSSGNVSVLLGNGDGTFQPARSYAVDLDPTSVAVGDFDGDGTLDLVTANHSSVSVLLGNGDGTFQPALNYAAGTAHLSVAVGDLNGDARPDLVTANGSGVGVLLNTTLFPQTITFPSVANHTYGDTPFAVLATASSGLPVSFAVGAADTCTIGGNLVTVTGAGSCTVTASQPGNTIYGAAFPVAQTFSIGPAPLTITANDKTMSYGGPLPMFDASYSGFVDGENSSVVGGLNCGTSATASSPPGQYPITCSGASATNYTINYRPGTLTIQPAQTTPPSTSASGATAHGTPYTFDTWTNDAPVQVTLNASETGGGGSVTTYYAVDTAACSAGVTGLGCSIYSGPFTVAGDGRHTITFFSVDQAGTVEPAHSVLVMIDTTPPQTRASVAGTMGNAGWYTSPVQVTLQASDTGGSGVATTYAGIDDPTCGPASLASLPSATCAIYNGPLSVGDGTHTVYFFSMDIAGNAEQQESQPVSVDTQPPTGVTPQPSRGPDSNGWYNHAFSVSWTGLDSGSGLASCTTGSTYSGPDTAGATVMGTCTDVAGNTSAPVPFSFQYDGTKPALNPTVSPNPAILNGSNGSATANPGASDNLSGVAQSSCAPLDLTSVGTKSVACTATDIAGNSNSASVSYSVEYASIGISCDGSPGHQILQPINADNSSVFKLGSFVPAKFRVCDAQGSSVGPTSSQPTVVQSFLQTGTSADPNATVDESTYSGTPDTAFRWDATNQQWIFNMSTKGLTAGTTYFYRINLIDGTAITFQFALR